MEFGIFDQLPCSSEQASERRYSEFIGQCTLADELNFDSIWMAEYHFNPNFSIMPSPLLVGSAVAQCTTRIKIGTAVSLLPLHHPVRLAEEVATLDVISGGRALFGIGRGSNPEHYSGLGINMDEARSRFLEGLDVVKEAWTSELLCHSGPHYNIDNIRVVPKPLQKPHPPIYIASNSPDTFPIVGELGHNILVTPIIITTQGVIDNLAVYRKNLIEHGHKTSDVKVIPTLAACVSNDRGKARELLEVTLDNYLGVLRSGQSRRSSRASQLTAKSIIEDYAIVGDPSECIEKILEIEESMDCQGILFWQNIGGLVPHEELNRSMRLFSEKVMSHFR
ncbi:MAG: LLM class flavin-dependent oxidoreductase [Chloroflexota bacterium]|nr:LLM class flavin-dependent oxidoreductase [Chloroflexota bacterium]